MAHQGTILVCVLTLALAGCTGPSNGSNAFDAVKGGSGSGGGSVEEVNAQILSFTGDLVTADNSGSSVEVFTATLFDANGEKSMAGLELFIEIRGAGEGSSSRIITQPEAVKGDPQPVEFDAGGWKVWSDAQRDGKLTAAFRYVYPLGTPPGAYTITMSLKDEGIVVATSAPDATAVEVFSEIAVDPTPYKADGSPATGPGGAPANWGEWTARPGATNVESLNYIKLTNTGQDASASVVIDFSAAAFSGADANYTIPLDGNIQFAFFEDTSPGTSAPNEGTYVYGGASADGSVTVTFTGLGNIIYVVYRVVEIPAVVAAQTYGAAFTATEL